MAAIHAASLGARVQLLEATPDGGRKILISGGGRCNILPGELDETRFVTDSSAHTLRKLLRSWPHAAQRAWFEETLQLPLVLEPETGKLFPVANRARVVRDKLVDLARARGVKWITGARVTEIRPAENAWTIAIADGTALLVDRVVLSTGGLSVPSTGSDGFGLTSLARLGHTVHSTYPALTPLTLDPPAFSELSGISLDVTITAASDTHRATASGGFLFTHRGYSGPAVLDVSHVVVRSLLTGGTPAKLTVQWSPLDAVAWAALLEPSAQHIGTVVRREMPARLADALLRHASIDATTPLAQLTRPARHRLVEALTRFPLPSTGDEGYRKAEVTGGGVALDEVDPRTLESRIHPGLFLAGELLDAFGPIGGYNFAWAWATGRAAGIGAST
jgi:predicted Rossmann fold flavoprotein